MTGISRNIRAASPSMGRTSCSFRPAPGACPNRFGKSNSKGHAVFNLFYVAGVNRVGQDEGESASCFGSSMIVNPRGEVIATASDRDEEVLVGEIDLDLISKVRSDWGLYRDRRPEAYGALVEL